MEATAYRVRWIGELREGFGARDGKWRLKDPSKIASFSDARWEVQPLFRAVSPDAPPQEVTDEMVAAMMAMPHIFSDAPKQHQSKMWCRAALMEALKVAPASPLIVNGSVATWAVSAARPSPDTTRAVREALTKLVAQIRVDDCSEPGFICWWRDREYPALPLSSESPAIPPSEKV